MKLCEECGEFKKSEEFPVVGYSWPLINGVRVQETTRSYFCKDCYFIPKREGERT